MLTQNFVSGNVNPCDSESRISVGVEFVNGHLPIVYAATETNGPYGNSVLPAFAGYGRAVVWILKAWSW